MDGKKIKQYVCASELRHTDGTSTSGIGTICHELGHLLGAHDFYDVDYGASGGEFLGTWQWDLMGSGSRNGDGDYPAYHNPYTKTHTFGWATAQDLPADNTQVTLLPAESNSNSFYKLNTTTPGEYFLLENRRPTFDSDLPGSGMLIYHVHSQIESDPDAINVTHPQKFYPVCAYSLPLEEPNSNPSSYHITSDASTFPGTHNITSFTNTTIPSAKSWAGAPSGKGLYFITENGYNITFVVNPAITGPSQICSQGTYTINSLPDGATVAWSNNSLLEYVSGQGTNSYTVQGLSQGSGMLTATLTMLQGYTVSLTYPVWVGKPSTPTSISGFVSGQVLVGNGIYNFSVDNPLLENVTQFNWIIRGGVITNEQNTPYIEVLTNKGKTDTYFDIKVNAQNTCGCSDNLWLIGSIKPNGGPIVIDAYPNPASSQIEVNLTDNVASDALKASPNVRATTSYAVKIIDSYGSTVYSATKKEKKFTISTASFRNGIYTVIISDGVNVYQNKLIVKH